MLVIRHIFSSFGPFNEIQRKYKNTPLFCWFNRPQILFFGDIKIHTIAIITKHFFSFFPIWWQLMSCRPWGKKLSVAGVNFVCSSYLMKRWTAPLNGNSCWFMQFVEGTTSWLLNLAKQLVVNNLILFIQTTAKARRFGRYPQGYIKSATNELYNKLLRQLIEWKFKKNWEKMIIVSRGYYTNWASLFPRD